jgi:hypothetical protein
MVDVYFKPQRRKYDCPREDVVWLRAKTMEAKMVVELDL